MFADLKSLGNTEKVTYKSVVKPNKLKIAALTTKDCERVPAFAKYFIVNDKKLDRFHIPEISAEQYAKIAEIFKKSSKFDERNLKLETASSYYVRKARVINLANELGVSPSFIDTTDYYWDENMYTEFDFWHNLDLVEESWRNEGEDLRNASSYKVYIEMDAKSAYLDESLYTDLYKLCYKAVVIRKAMLLCKVDKCISFLQSIVDYTNGFSENITVAHRQTMMGYFTFFKELLTDDSFREFAATHNDIDVFANNPSTHRDYVESYRSMMRGLTRCSGDDLGFFKTDLSMVEDPYLDELLAKTTDPEDYLSGTYLNNKA